MSSIIIPYSNRTAKFTFVINKIFTMFLTTFKRIITTTWTDELV